MRIHVEAVNSSQVSEELSTTSGKRLLISYVHICVTKSTTNSSFFYSHDVLSISSVFKLQINMKH